MSHKANKPMIMLRALLQGQKIKTMIGGLPYEICLGENEKGKTVTGVLAEKNGEEVLLTIDLSLGDFIDMANEISEDEAFIMNANVVLNED